MIPPGAGARPDDERYAGPPPTLRPGPDQLPPAPWPQPAPWPPQGAAWPQQGPWVPQPGPWPPQVVWAPPPGTPPHDEPQPFLRAMRARDWAWWRPLVGLLLLAVVFGVASAVVGVLGLLTGISPDLTMDDLLDPAVLLVTNGALVVAIPVVWLAWAVAHGMRPGWSSSVLARLRWRLLPRLTLLALATLGLVIAAGVAFDLTAGEGQVEGPIPGWGWLLVVVLLTTPLQSAAEEYLFRGYLSQAIAGWVRRPSVGAVLAAVVTGTLFSLAHLPPDLPTFLDRFFFALAASAVVWLTGGLEAAIVLHAVNNVLLFVLAGLLGEDVIAMGEVPEGAGLASLAFGVLGMAGYVAAVAWWARRARPERRTEAQDLRPPWLRPAAAAPDPAA
ncbi:CPBP family intramembrane metalloprotease [Blastococcus saxobsidens]|uniref:CPBP family intramembrane metalloprotease n=1 Tax=Blastococcus saxobsidens TaxID=138336 RepID=A0A6L9W3P5_9ACTN|nr:CPBP family intramembrane glutamic endopeptidase [Blastococcus saxobsidens]NEK86422.1 CPBP family intramembrane metalloprotease [Blastococcus saxobsidens]